MNIAEFAGHLHPVLVHLPIGILLLAGLLQLLALKPKYTSLHTAISIALFWGMISAVLSCVSGYVLSQNGDYNEGLVDTHKWSGIITAFVAIIAYLFSKKKNVLAKWAILIMCIGIVITGHLGGTLTHGEGYLTAGFTAKTVQVKEIKPVADVQEAIAYTDIVQPILESKCYSCHNKSKQKAGLRLDEPSFILKGGKDGAVIKAGNADASDLIKRLLLPHNDDGHMPPKEKPQLKENEIALLHWWIATGVSFDKKVSQLEQPEKMKPLLLALQGKATKRPIPDVPEHPVEAANEKIIQQLRDRGVVILPAATNNNYLFANFVTVDSVTEKDISLLTAVKKQLIWLKLNNKPVTDALLAKIGELTNLTRLQLDHTAITDKGIAALRSLTNLQYLNLVGTAVTAPGIMQLKGLPNLQEVYLYKTAVNASGLQMLKDSFPKIILDTGGYIVPVFEADTTIVKAPAKK